MAFLSFRHSSVLVVVSALLVGVMLSFGAASARAAEDFKIAVVDMQKALQSVEAGKKAKSQLEREVESRKKEFDTEKASISKMGEEFKKQSLVMSDDARAKRQGELQERVMKLQEKGAQTEQELRMKEQQLTQPILNKLRTIIAEMAKKKGYSMILEKSESTVLYSQDRDDLTQEVIGTFNKSSG